MLRRPRPPSPREISFPGSHEEPYLLAALADDYTEIRRFIFVEGKADRRFIGMATPRDTRNALAKSLEEDQYEAKYQTTQRGTNPGDPLSSKVVSICYAWPSQFGSKENAEENSFGGRLVDKGFLKTCLGDKLDEGRISWDGRMTRLLQFQIVEWQAAYTPLVQDGPLREVASRGQLALRIAEATLRRQMG